MKKKKKKEENQEQEFFYQNQKEWLFDDAQDTKQTYCRIRLR